MKMTDIPENVMAVMKDSTKVLVTASANGQPHAIVCGSIMAPAKDKVIVGEILMKRAAENLKANGKAAILLCAGKASYEIALKNPVRMDDGDMLAKMNEGLAKVGLKANALWAFDVCAVFDESAGPNAGKKIA